MNWLATDAACELVATCGSEEVWEVAASLDPGRPHQIRSGHRGAGSPGRRIEGTEGSRSRGLELSSMPAVAVGQRGPRACGGGAAGGHSGDGGCRARWGRRVGGDHGGDGRRAGRRAGGGRCGRARRSSSGGA
jgi:hypothetical protein